MRPGSAYIPDAFCNIRKINCLEVYIYIILTLNRPHSSRGEESDLLWWCQGSYNAHVFHCTGNYLLGRFLACSDIIEMHFLCGLPDDKPLASEQIMFKIFSLLQVNFVPKIGTFQGTPPPPPSTCLIWSREMSVHLFSFERDSFHQTVRTDWKVAWPFQTECCHWSVEATALCKHEVWSLVFELNSCPWCA